jgi:hypothetical protein
VEALVVVVLLQAELVELQQQIKDLAVELVQSPIVRVEVVEVVVRLLLVLLD